MSNEGLSLFMPGHLDDYPLNPIEFRLLCRIARRAGTNSACFQSQRKIATELGIRREAVGRALRVLLAVQVISRRGRGYRPNASKLWLDADDVPRIRAQVMGQILAEQAGRKAERSAHRAKAEAQRVAARERFRVVMT